MKFLAFLMAAAAWAAAPDFEYNRNAPLDLQEKGVQTRAGVTVRDFSFASAAGGRTAAYLVVSPKPGKHAGVLFAHWYEPEARDSNRTQFLSEAVALAGHGVTSLLVETMWSEPKWFRARKPEEDFAASVRQVKELRRALDVLAAQPDVDAARLLYAGHDFGAMYGAVLAGVDKRVRAAALVAGSTRFSDWFLLGRKLEGAERQKVVDELAPLDPVAYVGKAAGPVLLQFGTSDFYVPAKRADEFEAAAKDPKQALRYDAGHAMNQQAARDRFGWLLAQARVTGGVEVGEINGAQFRIDVPEKWNGGLVVYCHGYSPSPGTYGKGAANPMMRVFLDQGFAVAQSGYAAGGWAVEEAMLDTPALVRYFETRYGKAKETFVTGHSMGGFLTMALMERYPQVFQGGLALCGPLEAAGSFFRRPFDMRVVFDYYFPGALPSPERVPPDYMLSAELNAKVEKALEGNAHHAEQVRRFSAIKTNKELAGTLVFFTYILMDL